MPAVQHGREMDEKENLERAVKLFREAYRRQMEGELEEAMRLYQESNSAKRP